MQNFDLVIVGAGLVGASLALALAQATQLNILVLEQKKLEKSDVLDDFAQKTLAINQGTKLFFDELGIWPKEKNQGDFLTAIKGVHVSMQNALGQFQFSPPKNYDALGYIIQAKLLEKLILDALAKNTNNSVTWVQPISNLSLQPILGGWQVEYSDTLQQKKCQIRTKCIIGADGPQSIVKKSLGISDKLSDYHHIATIANIRLKQNHEGMAYERFTEEGGAIALLPYGLPNQMTLVLTAHSDQAKEYHDLTSQAFLEKLTDQMGGRLSFTAVSKRIQVPLNMKIATHQTARRAILMGNSAHFLHPIAAQGLNLSIQDISALIQLIQRQSKPVLNLDYIGSASMLHDYVCAREESQAQYIRVTDKIATYYSSQTLPSWFKGMSLFLLDNIPIKKYFTKKSMGIA
jgi:2-octaprenyl-6-methoxyphenol hydroxylase